jgi:hypothetical protein
MHGLAALGVALLTSCVAPGSQAEFDRWLDTDPARAAAFDRFEAMLRAEGVSGVVPDYQLWLVDRKTPKCADAPYFAPPEDRWTDIVPALRFIRDHVEPAIGDVRVVSGYRDEAFNTCVRGAPQSAHRSFQALDLVPVDRTVGRADLIAALCPLHAREGRAAGIGLGVYAGQRFHIDARSYRGWGENHHADTFPCAQTS